jgi:colicin import membrane protein
MKISNLSCALCILAFGTMIYSVRAGDNEAQAAARAALEAKFQSLSPAPAAKPATSVAPVSPNSAAQKQANIAMEAEAEAAKAEQDAARLAADAQAKMQAATEAEAKAKNQAAVAAQAREKAIKARQEAEQAMAAADVGSQINTVAKNQAGAQAQTQAKAQPPRQSAAMAGLNSPGLKPITAPALPVSAAKQSQLDVLLDLYKADRLSPAAYQKQRSLILSGK